MLFPMQRQLAALAKVLQAKLALVGAVTSVDSQVLAQVLARGKDSLASRTLIRDKAGVCAA